MMMRRFLSSLVLLALLAIPSAAWFAGGQQYVGFNVGGGGGAQALLLGETDGLAVDFTDQTALVRDATTAANNYTGNPFGLLSYPSPSVKLTRQQDGVYRYGNHNLTLQSQAFDNAAWAKTGCTVVGDSQTAPDGTATADRVTGTASSHLINDTSSIAVLSGVDYQSTVYLKANNFQWVRYNVGNNNAGTNAVNVWFDLTNGVVGSNNLSGAGWTFVSATITSAGNGWWRVSLVANTGTTTFISRIAPVTADTSTTRPDVGSGAGVGVIYDAWGSELKKTPVQETAGLPGYIATTSVAKYSLPYEWDTSGVPQGALIELGNTNLVLQSQAFDNASWTKTSTTTTANSLAAPDGTTTGDTVTASGANGTIQQNFTFGNNVATYGSIYLERKTGTGTVTVEQAKNVTTPTLTGAWQRVEVAGTGSTGATYALVSNVVTVTWTAHNLTTGDAVRADITSGTATDQSVASVTVTGANTFTFALVAADTSGNVTVYPRTLKIKLATSGDEVYAWGAQSEGTGSAGTATATSPIHTTTATVARAGDRFQIARASLPWSDTASAVYASFYPVESALTYYITGWEVDSASTDYVAVRHNTTTGNYFVSDENAIHVSSISGGTLNVSAINKLIGTGATNDFAVSLNGAAAVTQASGGTMASGDDLTHFFIGNVLGTASRQMQGYIRQVMWVPRRMTNTEIQNKSTP